MRQNSQLSAKVTFVPFDQTGRMHPLQSGVPSQLKVNELFTSCRVWGKTEALIFEPGIEYNVTLELIFWDHCKDNIYAGMPLQLSEGDRIVGMGTIVGIETRQA